MAQDFYLGSDTLISVNGKSSKFRSMRISLPDREATFEPLDDDGIYRRALTPDPTITLEGFESDASLAGNFATWVDARLSQAPISSLTWTNKGTSPASRIPTSFFTKYPVSSWCVASVDGGPSGQLEATMFSVTLKPRNVAPTT